MNAKLSALAQLSAAGFPQLGGLGSAQEFVTLTRSVSFWRESLCAAGGQHPARAAAEPFAPRSLPCRSPVAAHAWMTTNGRRAPRRKPWRGGTSISADTRSWAWQGSRDAAFVWPLAWPAATDRQCKLHANLRATVCKGQCELARGGRRREPETRAPPTTGSLWGLPAVAAWRLLVAMEGGALHLLLSGHH